MKKGFTLVELLAVIVIIGIISLIVVPIITDVIEDSEQKALKSSAYGLIESGKIYYSKSLSKPSDYPVPKTFDGPSYELLDFDGKKYSGRLIVKNDKNIAVAIYDEEMCAYKNLDETKVQLSEINQEECLAKIKLPLCLKKQDDSGILYNCNVADNVNKDFYLLEQESENVILLATQNIPNILVDMWDIYEKTVSENLKSLNYNKVKVSLPTKTQLEKFNNNLIKDSVFWTRTSSFYGEASIEVSLLANILNDKKIVTKLNYSNDKVIITPMASEPSYWLYNLGNFVDTSYGNNYPIREVIIVPKNEIEL